MDSHRSVLLAAGPFVKRNAVDHTFYTTSGVLRTIELILGLEADEPLRRAATPLYNAFVGTPNLGAVSALDAAGADSTKRIFPRRPAQPHRSRWIFRSRIAHPKCC